MDLLPAVTACAVFLGAYVLIATEWIPPPPPLSAGGADAGAGLADAHTASFSEDTGVDWNVVFLLLGMMVIVACCG